MWTAKPYGGAFRLVVKLSGQCLGVAGGSLASGARAVQNPCTGAKSELWSFVPVGSAFHIVSVSSAQCLYVSKGSSADGTQIIQSPCTTSAAMNWIVWSGLLMPSSPANLQADHSGQCLVVAGASKTVGANVVQYPCSGAAGEQWSFVASGGYFRVVSNNSGQCLTVSGASTASGAKIVQDTCASASNKLWTLTPYGAGAYQVRAFNSGMCVAVSNASNAAGAQVVQASCGSSSSGLWSVSLAATPSKWTSVIPLSVDPIAIANLPSGEILMWSADSQYTFLGDIGLTKSKTYTGIFDPATNTSSQVVVSNTGHAMFCPGTANLVDGRIFVNGGSSSPRTSIYDPDTGHWAGAANMNVPRGYQGDTLLSSGAVFTLGGSWSGGLGGKSGEVWSETGGWKLLSGVPETSIVGPDPKGVYRADNHLWLFAVAGDQVFHAGPSAEMHWIDATESGSIRSAGSRSDDAYSINGNAVLYGVGQILKVGGAPAYSDVNASAAAYRININGGVSVTKLAPMAFPRAFSNAVVLPNGQVVVVGGQTYPVPFTDSTAVLTPEIWDPSTRVFKRLLPMKTPRTYHSTAILMADGRVWVGGGGQCGASCIANHFDAEILSPPYLLNADGSTATRPGITRVAATTSLGSMLPIATDGPVTSFTLIRLSSVTHTVNNDQRRIPLNILSTGGATAYTVQIPSDSGVVLPGYYMLFALNGNGVPSVAATILIG